MPKTLNIDLVKSWIRKKDIQSLKNHHDLLINSFYLQDDRGNTFLHYCAKKNNEIMAKFFLDFENNKMNQQELIRKHLQLTNKKMAQSLSAAENSARQAKKSKNMNVKKKDGASPARQAENDNDEQFNTMNKADAAVVAANIALLRGKSHSLEAEQNNNNSLSEHNILAIPEPVPHESERKLFFGSKAPRLQMIQNKDGHLPIHIAAGHFEGNDKSSVLATLIEYDAYNHTNINSILVSLKFRDPHYHLTPLHEALLKKSQGAMILLNEVYKFAEGSGNRHKILKHKMKSSDPNAPKKFIYKLLRELILAKDNYGENCLHYAAAYGCLEPLEKILEILREADILLDKDNNPNYNGPINYMKVANKSGKLPIHLAARDGQNQIMQAECVNKLVDFEREFFGSSRFGNNSGDTAVISATAASTSKFYPFEHITSQLEIVDNEGYLALHLAIEGGHVAIVRTLLRVMINNLPDIKFQKMLNQPTRETGSTPFLLAAKNGVEFVRLLHQNYNCDITSITDDGNNALMVAAEEDEPLVVEYLLERKLIDKSEFNCPEININDVNHNERSAFMLACCEGNVKVVDIFLTYYIRETQDGSRNYTPEDENGKCYLIPDNRKLKIDLEDDLECTVLHWIAHNFDDDIESYENILSKIHQKMDPGEWNIFGRKTDWQGNTAMHTACKRGNIDVVSFFINQGLLASIDSKNEYDQTPLMMAVNHNHYDIMKFLLENSSNLTEDEDQNSNTALHIAAREGFLDICQTLVDYSADYHDKNQLGETALHLAAKHGRITICEYLLSLNSMEIDVLDKTNKTPLMLAAEFGSYQVVQFLLKKGAKPYLVTAKEEVWRNLENNEKNSKSQYLPIQQRIYKGGQNCLELAVDNNQYECAKAILLSDAWAECLRNVRFGKKGKIITPMRLLLTKYPDLAGIVLNRSVEYTDKKDHENGKETVRLNFEFIEDLYRIDWWHKRSGEDAHGSSFDGKNVVGLNDLVNDTKSKGPRSSAGSTSAWTMNKQKSMKAKTLFAVSPTFSENQDSTEKLISRASKDSKEDQIISVDVEPLSPNQVCEKTPFKLIQIFENTPKYDPDPIHINHDDIAQAKWTVPWSSDNKSSPNSNKPFLETNMSIISSEKHGDCSDDDELHDGYNYDDYNGQLKPDAQMYGYEYVTRNKNDPKDSISIEEDVKLDSQTYKSYHILSYIKRSRDVTLLRHPLVLALLRRKWNSYGKKYYWTDLILYLAFVISLNAFCVFFTPPAYMFSNEVQNNGGLTSYDHFNIQQNGTECSKFQDYLLVSNHTSDYYQTVGPQLCDPNSTFLRARFGVKWLVRIFWGFSIIVIKKKKLFFYR